MAIASATDAIDGPAFITRDAKTLNSDAASATAATAASATAASAAASTAAVSAINQRLPQPAQAFFVPGLQ
ncbi:MAG: hypothetical protein LBG81_05295 [Coriobacteriaceae bacterium]|jgi:hypothetical protein|nr:hypothetical protein [Coriobacteriaceae bacterium]